MTTTPSARNARNARTMMTVEKTGSDFWSLARKLPLPGDPPDSEGGCWEWQGNVTVEGYPRCKVEGRVIRANRFAWELVHGPIPTGWVIWHTCGNVLCVRPDHLEALPKREQCLRSRRAVTPERFWSQLERSPEPEGCWLWPGRRTHAGYGSLTLSVRGKPIAAHRYAWTLTNGPIPEGLDLLHRCGNSGCVRPDHLELATRSDTTRRYWQSVTHCKHGHPRTPENTFTASDGTHLCRLCHNDRVRRYAAKRRAHAAANTALNTTPNTETTLAPDDRSLAGS